MVTGAAGGIGAAVARRFAAEGARLLLTDVDGEGVRDVATRLGEDVAAWCVHDVTEESSWKAAIAQALDLHGRIDVLVNNAGIFLVAPLAETSLEQFRKVLDVNVVGVFLGMRAVADVMSERGGGTIVNVSSIAGIIGGPYMTAYAASKFAVRGMTKVAARELAQSGIRVCSVHPGHIDTEMLARQRERTPELVEKLIRGIPMRRIGSPDEVASAVLFLATDDSSFVTGAELVVDGGVT